MRDNIKVDLQDVGCGGPGLGQVAGTCECGNEPPMEYVYKGKMISK